MIVAAAVNERTTLAQCLARSPDIMSGAFRLMVYEGYSSAAKAYNAALNTCGDADYVIFAHQDVYLPYGSYARIRAELQRLSAIAPNWAVAGVIGGDATRTIIGETWCSGHRRILGHRVKAPTQVETLDEMLLIVRRAPNFDFDVNLPSFHLYGADIILAAAKVGMSAWVIDLPAIHHSKSVISLGGGYWQAYQYMQRKWAAQLPIYNLVCPLERGPWRYLITEARLRWRYRNLVERPEPRGDPAQIARELGYEMPPGLHAVT